MSPHEPPELLSALLDGALAPDERRRVEAHVEECAECRRELARLHQTVALLRRVEPAHAPVGFVDRVVAARPRPWYRRVAAAIFLPLSIKLPVELTALLLVGLLAVYVFERTPALQQAAREGTARTAPGLELTGKPSQPEPAKERQRLQDEFSQVERRDASPPRALSPGAPAAPVPPPVPQSASSAAPPPAPSAVATSPAPAPAVRPEAKTEASGENVAASGARPEGDTRQKAQERAAEAMRSAPSARLAAKRAQPSADVVARVAVKDRDAALQELTQLIARVGGRETDRHREGTATIVEALIPQGGYAEFSSGLAGIGPWQVEGERGDLPAMVRVILRLSE